MIPKIPVTVYEEKSAVKNHASEIAALGTKALIVTGKHSSRRNGSLTDAIAALESAGLPCVIFDEVEENPSVETAVRAARIAVSEHADLFIGIGGGSPMDAAKSIALLAKHPEGADRAETFFYTKGTDDAFPVVCVPTTCGTGSEVTQYSILTIHGKHTKKSIAHHIFAKLALVDPCYLKSSSYLGMVSCCTDALAHLLESYLNTNATEKSREIAREAMNVWGREKTFLLSEDAFRKMTEQDFAAFSHASVLAGEAIAFTGTSIPHGLSYAVTYELHVLHGRACGLFLPGFLKNYGNPSEVSAVLGFLGFADLTEFTDYMHVLSGTIAIPEELWRQDRAAILGNPAKLGNYPFPMTEEILKNYL